jgi:hypothetical protein
MRQRFQPPLDDSEGSLGLALEPAVDNSFGPT